VGYKYNWREVFNLRLEIAEADSVKPVTEDDLPPDIRRHLGERCQCRMACPVVHPNVTCQLDGHLIDQWDSHFRKTRSMSSGPKISKRIR
jgi:hypothetical protein